MTTSKRERKLKNDSRRGDDFLQLKRELEKAGIITRQGKVVFFNQKKGYGFVEVDGKDRFMHISVIEGGETPSKGDVFNVAVNNDNRITRANRIDYKGP